MQSKKSTIPCNCPQPPRILAPLEDASQIYELRARVIKALAHPVRLYVVDRLEQSEHCVGELVSLIRLDQSTVSKHLNILKSAGIVAVKKRGRESWYRLRTPCITEFFGCVESTIRSSIEVDQETDQTEIR